jgi:class 3 adenylate cyclase
MLDEPARGAVPDPRFHSLSGLERVRAFMRGQMLPLPIGTFLDISITEATSGSAVLRQVLSPWFDNGQGLLHLTPAVEVALYAAAITGFPPAVKPRTANLSMRYLRPCTVEAESVMIRSRILHTGSAFTTVEALVEDRLGRAVAHATGSVLLHPIEPAPPPLTAPLKPVDLPVYATPPPARRPLPWDREPWPGPAWDRLRRGAVPAGGEELPLPPIATLVGTRIVDVAPGRVRMAMPASDWFKGEFGEVAAGMVGSAGEIAIGLALAGIAEPDHRLRVSSFTENFLAPVVPTGQDLMAVASVRTRGEIIVCDAEVSESGGALVAVSQIACLLRREEPGPRARPPERLLLTVVFTDLVGSTELAGRLGPARWRALLEDHHALVRRQLELHRGREVKCTGDGFLATFDSPTRAVAFARAVRGGLDALDLAVRIGIHAGECEVMGSDVGGLAVHVASRIEATAGSREILVSNTVHDMLSGSGVAFADQGRHALKGIDGEHQLWAVVGFGDGGEAG